VNLFKKTSPQGYGEQDAALAAALDQAGTRERADELAQRHGLKDADDARAWLRERST
jgi:hypothetical protein